MRILEHRFWTEPELPEEAVRIMTSKTFDYLSELQDRLARELTQLGADTEGGHQRAQIHDSATLESHKNVVRGQIGMIGDLSVVYFIPHREETNRIFLGNKVRIWTDISGEEEDITLLGPDDAAVKIPNLAPETRVISYKSPIGKVLIDRCLNDWAVATVGESLVGVNIREISPGEF